jgi:hypothetical protein
MIHQALLAAFLPRGSLDAIWQEVLPREGSYILLLGLVAVLVVGTVRLWMKFK